jgi:hypothetical protein
MTPCGCQIAFKNKLFGAARCPQNRRSALAGSGIPNAIPLPKCRTIWQNFSHDSAFVGFPQASKRIRPEKPVIKGGIFPSTSR